MPTTLAHATDCRVTGVVLVCYRDGRKVFRPYVPTQDAGRYEFHVSAEVEPAEAAVSPRGE